MIKWPLYGSIGDSAQNRRRRCQPPNGAQTASSARDKGSTPFMTTSISPALIGIRQVFLRGDADGDNPVGIMLVYDFIEKLSGSDRRRPGGKTECRVNITDFGISGGDRPDRTVVCTISGRLFLLAL